jgi:hypothetical protein
MTLAGSELAVSLLKLHSADIRVGAQNLDGLSLKSSTLYAELQQKTCFQPPHNIFPQSLELLQLKIAPTIYH